VHPVLFEFDTPEFLRGILPDTIGVYTYGFLIACGVVAGFFYTAYQARKQYGVSYDTTQSLILILVVAALVGGKVFVVFEDPRHYLSNPGNLLSNLGSGFVLYGSLLFAIPAMLWFFKAKKLPVLGMLDIMAVTGCIAQAFGRMGCFMAGCCHGHPTGSFLGVRFHDPRCQAEPLGTPLHPTQLYEAGWLVLLMVFLIRYSRRKSFDGQLFLLYLALYALGRSVIEIFRGDESRGYLVEGWISNAQVVSALLILTVVYFYRRLQKREVLRSMGRRHPKR
jgi:phosphatidylglycerol---prolipoprotein diacylglyceryl transferase